MLEEAGGDAGRRLAGGVGGIAEPLGGLDAALDLADAGQVLVQLLPVARAQLIAQGARVVEHEVEDRPLLIQPLPEALDPLAGRPGAEEPLKGEPGVGLGRHRQGGRRPREVELVGA